MTIDGNGTITGLSAGGLPDASITTNDIANSSVTPSKLSQPLTLDTSKTATSTLVDFTGIPSWVKRITVMLSGVSTNGSSAIQVQIGSGSVTTSGYSGGTTANSTSGFNITGGIAASNVLNSVIVISPVSGNLYLMSANGSLSDTANFPKSGACNVTLSGAIDRVRITTLNGTDTFDAGTINILYE